MHTNHFLAALAEQLLAPERDPGQLASADLGAVRRRAARRRLAYYDTRYDNELVQERDHEVAEAMATIRRNGPADLRNTLDAIQSAFQYGDREDARHAFRVLRERGFLQSVPDPVPGGPRRYGCPIPSLASYAAARGFPPHHAATLGDADALNALVRRDRGALDIRDAMGRTPLHLAAECRWTDAAETLLAAGATPTRRTPPAQPHAGHSPNSPGRRGHRRRITTTVGGPAHPADREEWANGRRRRAARERVGAGAPPVRRRTSEHPINGRVEKDSGE